MAAEAPTPAPKISQPLVYYYEHLYPSELMIRLLTYGNARSLARREWSFTKTVTGEMGAQRELYTRYRSFENRGQLLQALRSFKPEKIDIGAVYNKEPKLRTQTMHFEALERELVFDIDVSDYDDVRACCQGKKICEHCWEFMAVGVRTVDFILQRDFGFKSRMWVFSGRRGVHCWVCDKEARALSDDERGAVAKFIHIADGGARTAVEQQLCKYGLESVHPTLQDVYDRFIIDAFNRIVLAEDGPNSLRTEKVAKAVETFIIERTVTAAAPRRVREALQQCVMGSIPPMEAWNRIGKELPKERWLLSALRLAFVYPRLDVEVSTKRNHLLKSPFAVHPGTGMVCVPLSVAAVGSFHPLNDAPKLSDLIAQRAERLDATADLAAFVEELERQEGRTGVATAGMP